MTQTIRHLAPGAILLLAALAVAAGCGDNDDPAAAVDGAASAADGGPADAGDTDAVGPQVTNPGTGIAVVNSDYKSVSISLLSPSGALVKDDCINSGTKPPAPGLALASDVILPSAPQAGGMLLLIDRTNAALTWVDPQTCAPVKQLSVATGFKANPQDVLSISPTKAYVTRSGRNEKPTAEPGDFDEGDDILIIDPSVPVIKGRIALGQLASPVEGKDILARPARAILADGKVFVGLSSSAPDHKSAGFGRLVVIDPATDMVTGMVDLPNLKLCRSMDYVSASKTLVVSCNGLYADGPMRSATSAIAWVDVAASPVAIKTTLPASVFGGRALGLERNLIATSATQGLVVSLGEFKAVPTDQLWLFDGETRTATKLLDSTVSFEFGDTIHDRVGGRLLLADASMTTPRVRVFTLASGALTEATAVNVNPSRGLPPRYMAWY